MYVIERICKELAARGNRPNTPVYCVPDILAESALKDFERRYKYPKEEQEITLG